MKQNLTEFLRQEVRYQIQSIRLEEAGFDRKLSVAFDILEEDVRQVSRTRNLNEGIDTIIGLWLSGPYIVKLFGKFVKYLDDIVKKFNDKGFGGEALAKKIIEFADKYHHKVMWIFEKVASKFTKDPKRITQISEMLFTAVIAGLLAVSVGGIVKSVKALSLDAGVFAKSMKAAVKSKEVMKGVQLAINEIIPEITAIARASLRTGAKASVQV